MATARAFDPELLYVECATCGQPVLWEPGKSTEVLEWSGLDAGNVDECCMIVSEGCPLCTPQEEFFTAHVIRLREDGRACEVAP